MTDSVKRFKLYDPFKRVLDIFFALVLLVITIPIQALVALFVVINLGTPVLFAQDRPGRNERVFRLMKFRTMRSPNPEKNLITDEQRLTRFGRILRSTSLDELPSLINVLKGEMSFVGPRPLLTKYLQLYNDRQRLRHTVRPGITGLAQVRGRNLLTWEQKFEYDVLYVEHRSFFLDLKILLTTVTAVLNRKGISADGQATVEEFRGELNED